MERIPVLIVDDCKIVRTALKAVLEQQENITVVGESSNGEEALKMVRKLKPRVVIMDIEMPGMNGLETTFRLLNSFPDICVIVLTVHNREPYQSVSLKHGAAKFLGKNISFQKLIKTINSLGKKSYREHAHAP